MEQIKELCIKHREILVYLIVGVLPTVFAWAIRFLWNIVFYAGTAHPLPVQTTILTIVEFIAGVSFAYPTNRKWVFRSTNQNILKEAAGFVNALKPSVVIPTHYGSIVGKPSDAEEFEKRVDDKILVVKKLKF